MFENRMSRHGVLRIVLQNVSLYYIVVKLILIKVEKAEVEGTSLLGD